MGIWLRLTGFLRGLESRIGDILLNIDTHGPVYFDRSGERRDSSDYETTSHLIVLAALRMAEISENDVAYVLGSGKGRALAHLARMRLRKVVGIELSEDLCRIAKSNMERLRDMKTPVEIRNGNVAGADLSEGTFFYMFNPFGPETMKLFLNNINSSRPGTRIVYLNPVCRSIFEEFPRLKIIRTEKYPIGPWIYIYEFQ